MDSHQGPQGMRSIFSWRRLWSQLIVCGTTGFNGKAQPAISWQLEAGNESEFRKPQTSSFSGSAGIYIYVCVYYIYIDAIWWYFIFVPLILCTIFRSQFRSKMQMLHFKRRYRTCTANDRQDTLLAEHWQLWSYVQHVAAPQQRCSAPGSQSSCWNVSQPNPQGRRRPGARCLEWCVATSNLQRSLKIPKTIGKKTS